MLRRQFRVYHVVVLICGYINVPYICIHYRINWGFSKVLFNNSSYNQILRLLSITVEELEALRLLDVEDLKEEVIGKNIKKGF